MGEGHKSRMKELVKSREEVLVKITVITMVCRVHKVVGDKYV